jgi:hypothetical protein
MDLPTALTIGVVTLVVVALLTGVVLFFRSWIWQKRSRRIAATITAIQMEADNVSFWWVVTAQWTDPQTGQTFSFRSRRFPFRPSLRIGESITVVMDPTNPRHYDMQL